MTEPTASESEPLLTQAASYLAYLRQDYQDDDPLRIPLPEEDVPEPLALLTSWLLAAEQVGMAEPNAMVLATVDAHGAPHTRTVLLKDMTAKGLEFFTNTLSQKGRDITQNSLVSVTFPWHPIRRQIQVHGQAQPLPAEVADAYFATRPRQAQIGAWASRQSQPLDTPAHLQQQFAQAEQRFAGEPVPRPPHWGGYLIVAQQVEFWRGQPSRLHERVRFTRVGQQWERAYLNP